MFRKMMDYGTFQCSNQEDFLDARNCSDTLSVPRNGYGTIKVKNQGKFRYWRYRAASNRKCCVAELRFFTKGNLLPFKRVVSCGDGLGGTVPENAFDGNGLTYYESALAKHGWVGVDFGSPVSVDSIAYLPRNDDNDIVEGQTYSLSYYEDGHEKTHSVVVAESGSLVFKDVPSGTVYILHNLDKGTEERLFTYKNNTIKWF